MNNKDKKALPSLKKETVDLRLNHLVSISIREPVKKDKCSAYRLGNQSRPRIDHKLKAAQCPN
jgi:hypothetical protein